MVLSPPPPAAELSGIAPHWSVRFAAMGTECRVDFALPTRGRAAEFAEEAVRWVGEFEAKYSRFREDSLLAEIHRAAGREWVTIDEDLERMLGLCAWFHWRTEGAFDPTMLPLARLWDYHAPAATAPDDAAIAAAAARVGWGKVERRPGAVRLAEPGMELDLGGIGKEYAVDQVAALARRLGVRDFLVDFGRDIRAAGSPPEGGPWRIGLEDPRTPDRCWGGVALDDRAVATSGNYRRFVELDGRRFGHILDPRTGRPAEHGAEAASVLAETCVEAGILSTAAVILGAEEGLRLIARSPHTAGAVWAGSLRHESPHFQKHAL